MRGPVASKKQGDEWMRSSRISVCYISKFENSNLIVTVKLVNKH